MQIYNILIHKIRNLMSPFFFFILLFTKLIYLLFIFLKTKYNIIQVLKYSLIYSY